MRSTLQIFEVEFVSLICPCPQGTRRWTSRMPPRLFPRHFARLYMRFTWEHGPIRSGAFKFKHLYFSLQATSIFWSTATQQHVEGWGLGCRNGVPNMDRMPVAWAHRLTIYDVKGYIRLVYHSIRTQRVYCNLILLLLFSLLLTPTFSLTSIVTLVKN